MAEQNKRFEMRLSFETKTRLAILAKLEDPTANKAKWIKRRIDDEWGDMIASGIKK